MKYLYFITLMLSSVFLSKAQSQDYYIDLEKQTIGFLEHHFYITQVIDARPVKNSIGQVQRGIANNKVNAVFKEGMEQELGSFLKRHFPKQEGLQPIIVKVLRFKVSEHTSAYSEKATAEIAIDFIQPKEDSYYMVHRATGIANSTGLDVTAAHDNNIVAALKDCLQQLERSNWQTKPESLTPLSWEQVKADYQVSGDIPAFPILSAENPQKGIYQSFLEFRNNTPGNTTAFDIETKPRTTKDWQGYQDVKLYQPDEEGKRKAVKNAWGFSDGSISYIYFQKEYFPIERENDALFFFGFAPPDPTTVAAASVLGGAIGGGIAAAATGGHRKKFVLDMLTGQISDFDKNGYEGRILSDKPAKIIIYYQKGKSASPVQLTFKNSTDSIQTALLPNSFVEIEWTELISGVSVCADGSPNACFTFLPKVDKVNYLEYVHASSGAQSIKIPKDQEAEFHLKKMRYAQELEEKRKAK